MKILDPDRADTANPIDFGDLGEDSGASETMNGARRIAVAEGSWTHPDQVAELVGLTSQTSTGTVRRP